MKTRHPLTARAISLLSSGLILAAGAASGQAVGDTYSYFYGANVQGSGYDYVNALPGNFNAFQINNANGAVSDTGTSIAQSPSLLNPATSFSQVWQLGSGFGSLNDGINGLTEQITSVTLYLYSSNVQPNNTSYEFGIYTGTQGAYSGSGTAGSLVTTFTLTDPTHEDAWVAIDIPLSVALAGFSIARPDAANPSPSFSAATETNPTAIFTPGFAVNTVMVPEPGSAVLVLLGTSLVLKRRRKN